MRRDEIVDLLFAGGECPWFFGVEFIAQELGLPMQHLHKIQKPGIYVWRCRECRLGLAQGSVIVLLRIFDDLQLDCRAKLRKRPVIDAFYMPMLAATSL